MNKITLPLSILAFALSIFSFFYFQSLSNQVYVDVNKLVDGYNKTALVRSDFEQNATKMRSNVDSLMQGWQQELKNYEKERSGYSAKELELKKKLLANKQSQISGYQQAVQKQLQEEDQKVTQTIINDINLFVKEYGKKHGHRIIFGATGGGTIMYADEASDLTDEILEELNDSFDGQ